MLHEVKVFSPDGKLKSIVSPKALSNRMWRQQGLTVKSYKEPTKAEKKAQEIENAKDKVKCMYCVKLFKPRQLTSKVCPANRCRQRHYRSFGAVPRGPKKCATCNKEFHATASRRFCNNPCVHRSKYRKKK